MTMTVKTTITIDDPTVRNQESAQLVNYLHKMKGLLQSPTVYANQSSSLCVVTWITVQGDIVAAAGMWWPMVMGAWLSLDKTLRTDQIIDVRVAVL